MEFQSLSRDSGRLNCFRSSRAPAGRLRFQSLSRDSGRLNRFLRRGIMAR